MAFKPTAANDFRLMVINSKPSKTGRLNYRTVIQFATDLGGVRDDDGLFTFKDGSRARVIGLRSGTPHVFINEQ